MARGNISLKVGITEIGVEELEAERESAAWITRRKQEGKESKQTTVMWTRKGKGVRHSCSEEGDWDGKEWRELSAQHEEDFPNGTR